MGKTTEEGLLEQITKDTTDMLGRRCGTEYITSGTTYTGRWFALLNISPGGNEIDCANTVSGISNFPNSATFTCYSGIPLYGEFTQIRVANGSWIAFIDCDQPVGI